MTIMTNNRIKELVFQSILTFIVFLFYSFDKNDPLIEFHEIVFFSNYVFASMVINNVLLPRFLYKKKYLWFLLGFCLVTMLAIVIEEGVIEKIFYPNTRGRHFSNIIFNLLDVLPPIIILSGFKLIWDATIRQKELDEIRIVAKESELQFLKSQINPHFLFNNMNNLYAHAIENSTKTPQIILALSDFLRYMLYDCKAKYVSVDKEIEQLKNFIDLHELQIEGRGTVDFSYHTVHEEFRIAPLLLMVFTENAFKHSSSSQTENIDITIDLNVNESGQLHFVCKNSFQSQSNTDSLSKGIGLGNVEKRLNLIYPERHLLSIDQSDDYYKVDLKIDLNRKSA